MTQEEFLAHLADAMQRDEVLTPQMNLDSIDEWDSLAIVSLITLYESLFRIQLTGNTLKNCKSVEDLIQLAKDHLQPL